MNIPSGSSSSDFYIMHTTRTLGKSVHQTSRSGLPQQLRSATGLSLDFQVWQVQLVLVQESPEGDSERGRHGNKAQIRRVECFWNVCSYSVMRITAIYMYIFICTCGQWSKEYSQEGNRISSFSISVSICWQMSRRDRSKFVCLCVCMCVCVCVHARACVCV